MDDETRPVKVHRVTLLIVDHDGLGAEGAANALRDAHYPNRCIAPRIIATETRETDWHDGHPLNRRNKWRAAAEALFGTPDSGGSS